MVDLDTPDLFSTSANVCRIMAEMFAIKITIYPLVRLFIRTIGLHKLRKPKENRLKTRHEKTTYIAVSGWFSV